jgi:hypothetical protein
MLSMARFVWGRGAFIEPPPRADDEAKLRLAYFTVFSTGDGELTVGAGLGFGRIVVSEIEASNTFANMV